MTFLNSNTRLQHIIGNNLWAYHSIGSLIPQTPDNILSGHYFPYSESYAELESSYELAMQGFYTYSLIALRSVLELALLGVYFAVDDNEHIEVRPWMLSEMKTPHRKTIINKLEKLQNFRVFDEQFDLSERIISVFDMLDGFVHKRGFQFSSRALAKSNRNCFLPESLNLYIEQMSTVVENAVIVHLIKYPIGMTPLPLSEKFGLNGPAGGYLEVDEVEIITSILKREEKALLIEICDQDQNAQQIIASIKSLPDLTDVDLQNQSEEWDRNHPELRIPKS